MSYIINSASHHQRCFTPATLLFIVNASHAINPVFKNGVIPHWTLSRNSMLYNQFYPTNNSIIFNGPIHNFETLCVKHCPISSSSHPEVLCENTFLENFTKFTFFWKTSQNFARKHYMAKFFLSDTSSLLAYNCYIKDSITGAFLQICEIKKSYFEKCGKFTGKHLFAVSF